MVSSLAVVRVITEVSRARETFLYLHWSIFCPPNHLPPKPCTQPGPQMVRPQTLDSDPLTLDFLSQTTITLQVKTAIHRFTDGYNTAQTSE